MRLGIVGTGKVSSWLCAAAREAGVTPVAVLSRTQESGRAFAEANGPLTVYTDEAMFHAADIDAVYIATPNRLHKSGAISAMRAGLHVLCEKPVALCAADWDEMCRVAHACGVVLMEAIRPLHDPAIAIIREHLPRLGKLRGAEISYCQYSSRYDAYRRGEILRAFDPTYGNAALMDIGIYVADIAAYLFGAPERVAASSVFLPNGFEGSGTATLSYPEMTVTLTYSKITEAVNPSVIYGEDGALTFRGTNAPCEIVYHPRGGTAVHLPYKPVANNLVWEVATFARLCHMGEVSHPYLHHTRVAMGIVDAIRTSAGIRFPFE